MDVSNSVQDQLDYPEHRLSIGPGCSTSAQVDKNQQTVTFRLRTGHRGLLAHLTRIGQADTATCRCGNDDQTPSQML